MALHVDIDPNLPIPGDGLNVIAQAVLPVLQSWDRGKIFENMAQDIKALTPHKIYETDLDGVESGDALGAVEFVGWRYILFSGEKSFAAAEIVIEDGSQKSGFSRVARGPDVEATVTELDQSRIGPKVAGDEFELRFLRIWDVRFCGLWLHCFASPEKSFVIPLPPVPANVEAGEDIPQTAFNERMQALAVGVVERFLMTP